MDHGGGQMNGNHTGFCAGSGRVMMSGFQTSFEPDGYCILYLFQDANVNTAVKYAFAVIGTFLMAMCIELLAYLRKRLLILPSLQEKRFLRALIISAIYGINMVLAYWIMLLVMTYEAMIFTAIILGLVFGHFLVLILPPPEQSKSGYEVIPSTTPCCGGANP